MRCAAPLSPLSASLDALTGPVDASKLWGTRVIFGLTSLVFLGQLAANAQRFGMGRLHELVLGALWGIGQFGGLSETFHTVSTEPFRLLSAVLVHVNALHFALNMLALAGLGRVAEPGVGTSRFVVAYFSCGVVGFAVSVTMAEILGNGGHTAGASGAVFGISGLILGWLFRTRDTRWGGADKRWLKYAVSTGASLLLVNLFPVNINNAAHVGGLLCGAVLGFYYASRPKPKSLLVPNVAAVAGLLLAITSLILAQRAAGFGRKPQARLDAAGETPTPDPQLPPDLDNPERD